MKTNGYNRKFTKDDLLKLKTRRKIYQFVLKNPGAHFREICRNLNFSTGTVSYHITYLEKRGLIATKHDSRYTAYYAINKYGTEEKNLLRNIKFDTTRNILFYLAIWGSASQIELSKELKKHPTTINFNLKRLVDLDLIELTPIVDNAIQLNTSIFVSRYKTGRELFYKIKNYARIYDLLIMYYNKNYYKGDIADAFSYLAKDISNLEHVVYPRKLKTVKQTMDEVEDALFDIFPHPYYC